MRHENKIQALIQDGESQELEFKASFGREAIETLAAFSNANGGRLLIGVTNKGEIAGMIEKYGSGIQRVLLSMRKANAKEPVFETNSGFFKVTLYPMESASEGVSEGVTQLYEFITGKPGLRVPALSDSLQAPRKNIERWLKTLRTQGKVEFRGAPKTGGYYIVNKINKP